MVDPNLAQQMDHSKQIRARNSQLSQKYSKYLAKTLSKLNSPESTGARAQSKVETIYSNQESIAKQNQEMIQSYQQLSSSATELHLKIDKTTQKLRDSRANAAQEKIELLDRNIRIIENCIKLVESTNTKPARAKKGLFG
ncbi:hypothetical protein OGAPHI_006545 [Ogataea philodendri]|uniref:Uncharacterized protein n=1 Tax=Ogataea philodendri TaxID=1378263 RepID=A0A9P8NXQ2_9ASCO|nr:uncharacterized protein OGAPHI_006545 [Ogataea philodendri]KAH3661695.1 hypothetical protein OGAPHI_006545 [Ogataea philodendri]